MGKRSAELGDRIGMLIFWHVVGALPLFLYAWFNVKDGGVGTGYFLFAVVVFAWADFLRVKRLSKFLKNFFLVLKLVFLLALFNYYFGFLVGAAVCIIYLAISMSEDENIISRKSNKKSKKNKKKYNKYDYLDLKENK